jgi:hypothetical protein
MRVWWWGWLGVLGWACGGPTTDDGPVDTDVGADGCEGAASGVQMGLDLAQGLLLDGADVPYGQPPQGGAPYTPLEVRFHGVLEPGTRVPITLTAVAPDGTPLGDITQTVGPLCANTGPHDGWWFGGEIHLRYWERTLEELEGREVEVTAEVVLDGGALTTAASGTLAWTL